MGLFGKDLPNFNEAMADQLESEGIRFGSELGLDAVNSKIPDGPWKIRFISGIVQVNKYAKDYGEEGNPNKGGIYSDARIIGGEYWDDIKRLTDLERTVKVKLTREMALQLSANVESVAIVKTGQSGNRYSNLYAGSITEQQSPDQIRAAYEDYLKQQGDADAVIQAKLSTTSIEDMKKALA